MENTDDAAAATRSARIVFENAENASLVDRALSGDKGIFPEAVRRAGREKTSPRFPLFYRYTSLLWAMDRIFTILVSSWTLYTIR